VRPGHGQVRREAEEDREAKEANGSQEVKVFKGKLRSRRLTSDCDVQIDSGGVPSIQNVTPAMPDGDYRLTVNGMNLGARFSNGVWKQIND
jgi:hypothetical protein